MAHVAKIAILANEVDSKQRHGLPPVATREKMVRLQVASNAPPAQMWRIKDDILRRLLDELDEASSTLLGLCFTPDDDEAVITIMDELMTDLPRKITLRMDELGWPEAHWEAAE